MLTDRKIYRSVRDLNYKNTILGRSDRLNPNKIIKMFREMGDSCAYCGGDAYTVHRPFPLSDSAPAGESNVLPTCEACLARFKFGNSDIYEQFRKGDISEELFLRIVRRLLAVDNNGEMRRYLLVITGIGLSPQK